MGRKVREIQDLVIDEISLVDKGANQHATVTIAKSADGEEENYMDIYDEQGNPLDPDALDIGDVIYDSNGEAYEVQADNDDEFDDELDDEYEDELELAEVGKSARGQLIRAGMTGRAASSAIRGSRAGRSLGRARSFPSRAGANRLRQRLEVNPGSMGPRTLRQSTAEDALAAFSRPGAGAQMAAIRGVQHAKTGASSAASSATGWAQAHKTPLMVAGGGLGAAGAGAGGGYAVTALDRRRRGGVKKSADELREELSKALTDRDRDEVIAKAFGQIEELAEAAEIAKAAAEQERNIRLHKEYYEVAKSYELPVNTDALARALRNMAEALPYEDVEVIGKALQFAAEANEALYTEVGSIGGGDNSDVLQMVNAYADEAVSKSGSSREQLVADIFNQNPEAYDEYLRERS